MLSAAFFAFQFMVAPPEKPPDFSGPFALGGYVLLALSAALFFLSNRGKQEHSASPGIPAPQLAWDVGGVFLASGGLVIAAIFVPFALNRSPWYLIGVIIFGVFGVGGLSAEIGRAVSGNPTWGAKTSISKPTAAKHELATQQRLLALFNELKDIADKTLPPEIKLSRVRDAIERVRQTVSFSQNLTARLEIAEEIPMPSGFWDENYEWRTLLLNVSTFIYKAYEHPDEW